MSLFALVPAPAPATSDLDRRFIEITTSMTEGLVRLDAVLRDPEVTEVMINGPHAVFVERRGVVQAIDLELTEIEIRRLIERVIAPLGLRLDRAQPLVDARLPGGARLHAAIPPVAPDGPCVTIRRASPFGLAIADFVEDPSARALLQWMVEARWNLLVAGATSSGKTTFLSALSREFVDHERVVSIEETLELRLVGRNVVRLEARSGNAEGAGTVTVRDLVRAALRLRPDRVVVGEVRGAEAADMVQALNTGHDGSMATIHANSTDDALRRVEHLAAMAPEAAAWPTRAMRAQITSAIDAVVFLRRGTNGGREVDAVGEVGSGASLRVLPLGRRTASGWSTIAAPSRPARGALA